MVSTLNALHVLHTACLNTLIPTACEVILLQNDNFEFTVINSTSDFSAPLPREDNSNHVGQLVNLPLHYLQQKSQNIVS